ncbi:fumarylacetoacetase [Thetidibacter halocola]|uniref:fumarylacetoacetase n=1 Tax=Thetidibacter halocola TaxID=2827239 RepID=A0A8J8B6H1_9RHOB|nr:fumarylacetoacetase [Thetidibacter halocola]MBS0124006.1 fumarylacetoacetase [Thetidibacter halocola]
MPLKSWIASANDGETDFPLENLPCGVFSVGDGDLRCGIAIGDRIVDATGLEEAGLLRPDPEALVLDAPAWNDFMELGPQAWASYRARLTAMLRHDAPDAARDAIATYSVPMRKAALHMPFRVAEYTDFYASRHHATNVGTMFRGPDNALPPNWLSIPIGYNGRASSVVVSRNPVRRPWGQVKAPDEALPHFAPSTRFDFELELGAIVGLPSDGPVSVARAEAMIFGYVLLNDWSARDIQAWEYQPLGPFQAKATATSISPWIVPAAALAPFRRPVPDRLRPVLPHLDEPHPTGLDIALEIGLTPQDGVETVIARTNASELYWSAAQQLAHHTTSGCPMRVGDLLGSGTVSGAAPDSRGALLELSWNGEKPITLADGQSRSFLDDGDTVTLRGHAQGAGFRIGFGACTGTVLPALDDPYPA